MRRFVTRTDGFSLKDLLLNYQIEFSERDYDAHMMPRVNWKKVRFIRVTSDGWPVHGETKLKLLKERYVCLGINAFEALLKDFNLKEERSILAHFKKTQGITSIDFPGDVIVDEKGNRHILRIFWDGDRVNWGPEMLDAFYNETQAAAVLMPHWIIRVGMAICNAMNTLRGKQM